MWFKTGIAVLVLTLLFTYIRDWGGYKNELIVKTTPLDTEYDYIVVGAGSAGSVVASRISEDKESKVLLLEAGGHFNENPLFHVPNAFFSLHHTDSDWGYYSEPQKQSCLGLNEQRSYWPRGKVLGGTSVFNAMQYTRGSSFEFDEWADHGCEGWGYKDVLPYFLKSEDIHVDELKSSKFHRQGGMMAVSDGVVTPMIDYYLKAGQEMGYKVTDYNSASPEGYSRSQLTIRKGVRSSTGLEFLGGTGNRDNLDIALRVYVTKVLIEDKKATGVFYIQNGRKYFVKANKEVILSAGAINSPQLLMLSGVGPKAHLEELGIPVIANLPVGQNLQDHEMVMMLSKVNTPGSITPDIAGSLWSRLQYELFGTGQKSSPFCEGMGFWHLDPSKREKTYPDIQAMYFSTLLADNNFNFKESVASEYLSKSGNINGFTSLFFLTHPKSTGSIKLRSADPFDYPIIDPQYFTDKRDIADLVKGIRIWEEFVQTPTMKKLGVDIKQMKLSICSDHEFRSDAYWECFVRHLAVTVYHHSSTCKMGAESDSTAVVDPQLRVKGIKGLRVVDASVFPNVTAGNTNAPTIMVAEKAADMIRGKDTVKEFRYK